MEAGARTLFRSLERFRALPDHLQVWPGHGAGSACGKALGAVPSSTVGYEKRSNWGVAETDEASFVAAVLEGQPEPPRYFAAMKRINRDGPPVLGQMPVARRLGATDVLAGASKSSRWIVDLRPARQFADGFIAGSLSLPYAKSFSTWTGSIIPVTDELVLMSDGDDDAVRWAVRDLSRIGFDRMLGWVDASEALHAWREAGHALQTVPQLSVTDVASTRADLAATVVDVRGRTEWDAGHLGGAMHIPLGDLRQRWHELPTTPLLVHCQSGARSAVATSLLHRLGRTDAVDIRGGFTAWRAAGLPLSGQVE